MKKLLWLTITTLLSLLVFVATGPFLTLRSLERAAADNRIIPIVWLVDFPTLRSSLKAQLNDRVVRTAGIDVQASLLGQLGLRASGAIVDSTVEALVNPVGIAGLMQGRKTWVAMLGVPASVDKDATPASTASALDSAQFRYETLSRFTATLKHDDGTQTVFVLTRSGVFWRLSDIRLPL